MEDAAFDEAAFHHWLSGDPRRKSTFEAMWRRVMGPNMDSVLREYGRSESARRRKLASVAAVVFLSIGGYQLFPTIELHLTEPQTFVAAEGSVRSFTLPDGSRLTLAGGTRASVRFTRSNRVVELSQGAVFADVAHDTARPFRIRTGGADIVDIGTSFEVLSKPSNVRITVASGEVEFKREGWFQRSIHLQANQSATLNATGVSRLKSVDQGGVARWRDEWVEYRGAPLRRVVGDLESLSRLPIEIASDRLANQAVSGRIKLSSPTEQLENLAVIQSFRIERTPNALILRER